MPARHGPDEFFSFPGSRQAAIALPPMCPQKWPYQLGWSYSGWLCLDPFTGVSVDQEKPFLFWSVFTIRLLVIFGIRCLPDAPLFNYWLVSARCKKMHKVVFLFYFGPSPKWMMCFCKGKIVSLNMNCSVIVAVIIIFDSSLTDMTIHSFKKPLVYIIRFG